MNIAVIGTGYVGLVTGVCLAEMGHTVTCIDIDQEKVEKLSNGVSPIYEEGLEQLLRKNIHRGTLNFTTHYETGMKGKGIIFIAVGTPESAAGEADVTAIHTVSRQIATHLQQDAIIVTKSTVPIGTNETIKKTIEQHSTQYIQIVSNPEFLRQGTAVHDTFCGSRIVLGSEDEEALTTIEKVYKPFGLPIIKTDLKSAEMIKYASNTFLATKISFINEMAILCEQIDANIDDVAKGMGMDPRIGEDFLKAGIGYGGSCFPKDTNALIAIGEYARSPMHILRSVRDVNNQQWEIFVEKILRHFGSLRDITISMLGLAFKPNTDDMRKAPSIPIAHALINAGATINAYDPVATSNARKVLPMGINYVQSVEDALTHAHCAVILTDWKEIKEYDISLFKQYMKQPVIFDGRNCLKRNEMAECGVEYHSIGRGTIYPATEGIHSNPAR